MKKIGLAIALDGDSTFHTETFIAAFDYCRENFPALQDVAWKLVSDRKSQEGGVAAAGELIKWGAQAIVGHFSSRAALAAREHYARENIPLILPASTSSQLRVLQNEAGTPVFRYQHSDADLIRHCIDLAIGESGSGRVWLVVQDNDYGKAFLSHVNEQPNLYITRELPKGLRSDDQLILVGYDVFAEMIVASISTSRLKRLILLDDACSEKVISQCKEMPDQILRIRSLSPIASHGRGDLFWNETLLGIALAKSLVTGSTATKNLAVETFLGSQGFDCDGLYRGAEIHVESYHVSDKGGVWRSLISNA